MSKTTVIHHSADFDGLFCREIARKFLPDAELIGWDYGDPVPTPDVVSAEDNLYMLDISIDGLMGHPKLVWIDHHKSAMEKFTPRVSAGEKYEGRFGPQINGYRINGVAACRLAWQWFTADKRLREQSVFPEKHDEWMAKYPLPVESSFVDRQVAEPLAVRLAGEYDIWDKRDPDAELFQHGLRSQELTAQTWSMLLDPTVERALQGTGMEISNSELICRSLLNQGRCLQYAKTQENASIISDIGFTFKWEGLTFLACNAARYNSHLFTAGLTPEHDACFGFKWTGKDWSVSLYHAPGKEHHDLSLIAVKHGGGGHRGACGFRASKLPFIP